MTSRSGKSRVLFLFFLSDLKKMSDKYQRNFREDYMKFKKGVVNEMKREKSKNG